MLAEVMLDTNVLLYAISDHPEESEKRAIARALISQENWGLSVQVLQEFYVNVTRTKIAGQVPAMSFEQASQAVEQFLAFPVIANTPLLLRRAIQLHRTHSTSFWDASILAAAHELGARQLLSEDLNDGQSYGDVIVSNPFKGLSSRSQFR